MFPTMFIPSLFPTHDLHGGRPRRQTGRHSKQSRRPARAPVAQTANAGQASARPDPAYSSDWNVNFKTPNPQRGPNTDWETVNSCDVYVPAEPQAVLLFIGGLGAGVSARTFYGNLLTRVSEAGKVAIIAYRLPIVPTTRHQELARKAAAQLARSRDELTQLADLPTFGMGHSLGAKLMLLSCVESETRDLLKIRANILMSFSNARLQQALPMLRDAQGTASIQSGLGMMADLLGRFDASVISPDLSAAKQNLETTLRNAQTSIKGGSDFTPSSSETMMLAGTRYNVRENLMIRFQDDTLDDGEEIMKVLRTRFGKSGVLMWRLLSGNHVTPVTPDFSEGEFSSLGNVDWDSAVRQAGMNASDELEGAITVIVAFVRLQLELRRRREVA